MDIPLKFCKKYEFDSNLMGNVCKEIPEIFSEQYIEPLIQKQKDFEFHVSHFISAPKAKYKNNYKRIFNPKQISSPFAASQIIDDPNERIWIYIDEYDVVQGPFTTIEMDNWYNSHYFPMDLLLGLADRERCIRLGDFIISTYPFSKNPNLQIGKIQNFFQIINQYIQQFTLYKHTVYLLKHKFLQTNYMNYFFIFDTKVNSLQLALPKSNAKKFDTMITKTLRQEKLDEYKVNKRSKINLQNDLKMTGQKVENNIFIGCIIEKKSKDREAYQLIKDIQEFIIMEKKIKRNKRVKEYVQLQIDKYEKGGFKDGIAKTEESLRKATAKAKQNLLIAQQMQEELTGLDEEVKVVKDKAKNMRDDATTLQREAYIYNKKVTILVYGLLALMLILIGLYVVKIVL